MEDIIMHKIITISREFGSGGREVGKRLAEALGIAYYDKEIITAVAERSGLAEKYVEAVSEKSVQFYYPIAYGSSLSTMQPLVTEQSGVIAHQNDIIRELAEKGDCVIVGRAADVVLEEMHPLRVFVYANMESKIKRCKERQKEDENFTDKELEKQIKKIDKNRAGFREMITGNKFGSREDYDLMINTSGLDIKEMIPALVEYQKCFFGEDK